MPQEKPKQGNRCFAKKKIEDKEEDVHTRLRNRHDCSKRGKERKNEEANGSHNIAAASDDTPIYNRNRETPFL